MLLVRQGAVQGPYYTNHTCVVESGLPCRDFRAAVPPCARGARAATRKQPATKYLMLCVRTRMALPAWSLANNQLPTVIPNASVCRVAPRGHAAVPEGQLHVLGDVLEAGGGGWKEDQGRRSRGLGRRWGR